MTENQFSVDLGDIKLTDEQKAKINAAIQKAVVGELATIGNANQLAFFPVSGHGHKFPGPIIWGIIARPVKEQWMKDITVIK